MTSTLSILTALHRADGQFVRLQVSEAVLSDELRELAQLGYVIESHPHFGQRLISAPDRLIAEDLQARLATAGKPAMIGSEILVFEETTSTNDVVARLVPAREGEGVVVFAESQTKGRGRHGRAWTSPRGKGLWFSILLRPKFPLPRLTVAASVAVARVVRRMGLDARIKWPNDVILQGRKLSGILTETREGAAVLGIGINVNCRTEDFPEELRDVATSLERESGENVERPALAVALLRELDAVYGEALDRFEAVSAEWALWNTTLGKQIVVRMGNHEMAGHAQALDGDGALLIRRDNGRVERVLGADLTVERE